MHPIDQPQRRGLAFQMKRAGPSPAAIRSTGTRSPAAAMAAMTVSRPCQSRTEAHKAQDNPVAVALTSREIGIFGAARAVDGPHASPKGLRHGFGVAAVWAGIPLNLVQKWLGHAQLSTTAIYADAVGEEEQSIAARMW